MTKELVNEIRAYMRTDEGEKLFESCGAAYEGIRKLQDRYVLDYTLRDSWYSDELVLQGQESLEQVLDELKEALGQPA